MLKRVIIIICFQLGVFSLLAEDNGVRLTKVQISSDAPANLPPSPKIPSYQEFMDKTSSSLLNLKKNILANADKKDQKTVMLSNICADNLQKIVDQITFLMKRQKAYEANTFCSPIFEPDQCNIWSSEDCRKLAEKTQKLSEDLNNKAKDAELKGKTTAEVDSYKTASEVAVDVAKVYTELAQDHDSLSKSIDDLSSYMKNKKQTQVSN